MLLHQTIPQAPACNDNGLFAALRRRPAAPRTILGVAASMAGPISLTQVSDGVFIIGRECQDARRAARRSAR